MKLSGTAALAAFAAAFAAFGGAASAEEKIADPRLGEKVDRICFGRNINNFTTIKGVDDAILLEKDVNHWYKATLIGPCSYSELRFAQSVAIEQRPAGGCVTPGDYLVFSRSAFGDFSFPNATRCAISEIYEWNPKAEAAEEAEGEDDADDAE